MAIRSGMVAIQLFAVIFMVSVDGHIKAGPVPS